MFRANLPLFTLITNLLSKDREISDRWRGFKDVADSRHLANNVEPEVVAALVTAVRDNYPRISHRYYAMKARWLGKDALDFWDRNAPIFAEPKQVIPGRGARDRALGLCAFSPDMAQIARDFFDKSWIDAPVRPGKSPGAFAHPTVPSAHPYVMLNYMGKARDVMTLAHELGHGVHQILARDQGALMAPTPLTLAETASVFGEMLTFKSILAGTTNPREERPGSPEDRRQDQHRHSPDRLLRIRAPPAYRAPGRRADRRPDRRNLDGGAGRKPRPSVRLRAAMRSIGPMCRISFIRRSTSTPMPSATVW